MIKVLVAFFSGVMLSVLSTSLAHASETFPCGSGTYTITDGVVGSGNSCTGEIVIGTSATTIGAYAFQNSEATSITIPTSVTEFKYSAFYYMQNIKTISIPSSVRTIDNTTFLFTPLLSITVDAANPTFASVDGVLFNKAKTTLLTFPSGKDASAWTIPSGVTTIGNYAFFNVSSLTSLQIPEGVTYLNDSSVELCANLVAISIPSSLVRIDNAGTLGMNSPVSSISVAAANPSFTAVDGVLFDKNKTILWRFPEAKVATSYVIPPTVHTIQYGAFYSNKYLKSITIGDSVSTIVRGAIWVMYSLETLEISASATDIGTSLFLISSLKVTNINVNAGNPNYTSVDGVLFNKAKTELLIFPAARTGINYVIPSTVTTISDSAFSSSALTAVTIPNSVKTIKENAFYGSNLQTVVIPNSVTTIESYAFAYLSSLKQLTIGNGVTSLSSYAFYGNTNLVGYSYCGTALSATVLNDAGFSDKSNICGKEVPGAPSNVVATATGGTTASVTFTAPTSNGGSAITSYTATSMPGGLTGSIQQPGSGSITISGLNPETSYTFTVFATNLVGDGAASGASGSMTTDKNTYTFSCGNNATYTITDGVVGNGASCSGEIILTSKARKIGSYSFSNSQVSSIILPNSVTEIAYNAFSSMTQLKTINIPSSVITIGDTIFYGSSLLSIIVDPSNPNYTSVDGVLYNKDKTTLLSFPSGKDASTWSIPSSVTSIAAYAISNVSSLIKLQIPEGVTSIGYGAIDACENLTEISIPSTATIIESGYSLGWNSPKITIFNVAAANPNFSSVNGVLFNKDKTILIRYPEAKVGDSFAIPSTVLIIDFQAFFGASNIKSITMANSVTVIRNAAFSYMKLLESIEISSGVTLTPESMNELFYATPKLSAINVAANSANLTSVDGVLYTKDKSVLLAYPSGKSGTTYSIPTTVTTINDWAFNSSRLSSITIPSSVTTIGKYAFYLSEIEKITIPNSVTTIDNYAFQFMPKLNSLTISNSVTTLGASVFGYQIKLLGYSYCSGPLTQAVLDAAGLSGKANICGKETPSAPTIGKVKLKWGTTAEVAFTAAASTGGSPILSYTAISMPGGITGTIEQSGSGTIDVSGLRAGTTYTFTVVATNLVGDSTSSGTSESVTTNNVPGAPIIGEAIVGGSTKASVAFTAPASNGGATITAYVATAMPGGITAYLSQQGSGYIQVEGLNPSTAYTFTVVAINDVGESVASGTSQSITTDEASSYTFGCGGEATYTISDGVVTDAGGCSGDLVLSSKARNIGRMAFYNSQITSIIIPSSVNEIQDNAFYETPNLKTINLPSSIRIFGANAIVYSGISSITVDPANPKFSSVDGVLYNKDKTVLVKFPSLKDASTWSVPKNITEIASYAISGVSTLTKLLIPEGVIKVGRDIVSDAANLTEISIPSTVTVIEAPESLGWNCPKLTSINVASTNSNFSSVDGVFFNKDKTILLRFPNGKVADLYVIPAPVRIIGSYAFLGAVNVKSISMGNNLTTIGESSVQSLDSLESFEISASVTSIDVNSIFYATPKLTTINVASTNPNYTSINGVLFTKDMKVLLAYPANKPGASYTIPSTVTSISEFAFNFSTLTAVTIPESVTSIGRYAFYLSGIAKITIPNSVTTIDNYAFMSMANLKKLILPDSLVEVGDYSFGDNNKLLSYTYCGNVLTAEALQNAGLADKVNVCGKNEPGAPIIGVATATGTTSVDVAFTAPTSNGGSAIFSYTATVTPGGAIASISQEGSGVISIEGLDPATTYTFTVIATNLVGDSVSSSTVKAKTDKLTALIDEFDNKTGLFAGEAIAITAPTSESDGVWSYASSDPASVTVNGSNLVIKKVGSVTITATQAATDLYLASTKTFTTTIEKATAVIAAFDNRSGLYAGAAIAITAPTSASSGAWSYASSDAGVVSVDGSNLVINKVGTVTITATQAATDSYVASTQTFTTTIDKATAVIAAFDNKSGQFAGAAIAITAPTSASSGAWSYASSDATVVSVDGASLVINKVGSVTISATQAATDSYIASTKTFTVTIDKATAVIAAFDNKTGQFRGAAIAITTPTSASSGAWSYASSDAAIVSVDGSNLVINKAGSVTITATQAATDSYIASTKTFTVTIEAIAPTLGVFAPITVSFTNAPIAIVPPASPSDGAWTYVLTNPTVGTIVNGAVITAKAGTSILTGTQAATTNYLGAQFATTVVIKPSATVKVSKRTITISLKGATGKVLINGKTAKIGKNTVTAGKKLVSITVAGKEIYKKSFTIK